MNLQEFRIERLKEATDKEGIELLVASSSANINYLTGGYHSIAKDVSSGTEIYAAFDPKTKEIFYISSVAEIPGIIEHDADAVILPYGSFQFVKLNSIMYEKVDRFARNRYETGIDALAGLIKGKYVKIAIDEMAFDFMKYNNLMQKVPILKIVGGNNTFRLARLIKHQDEIDGIRKSVEIAETSLLKALDRFTRGDTELTLEQFYKEEVVKNSAVPYFFVATSDERSAFVDVVNKNKKIDEGSIIRFDFGCIYNNYYSDLARTAFVGEVDKKWEEQYRAIRGGQELGLSLLKPDANGKEIFSAIIDYVKENGIPNFSRGHCGHGIGLEGYDFPSIAPSDVRNIQKNMCINIEVPYYELGKGGLQIESTTVITDIGFKFLDSGELDVIRL